MPLALALSSGPLLRTRDMFLLAAPSPGFWGAPTSSVDWCEANYRYSPYICELYNTLSSFALVLAGLCGARFHWRVLERRFLLAFLALFTVGIGSVAFHATLQFELQMLDEVPMLWLALVMIYTLLENQPQRRFGPWFPALLVVHGALVSLLALSTRGRVEFWTFQVSFSSTEFYGLYRVWRIHRRSRNASVHRLFRWGMGFYLVAIALWSVDTHLCSFVGVTLPSWGLFNPQLHAVWHVLVSMGFYSLVLLIAYDRFDVLGVRAGLDRRFGIIPVLSRREGPPP
jgi:dihydroceramidase